MTRKKTKLRFSHEKRNFHSIDNLSTHYLYMKRIMLILGVFANG